MQNEPEVSFQSDDDPLPDPSDLRDPPVLSRGQGRFCGPKQERMADPDAQQDLIADALLERFLIYGDILQLRHAPLRYGGEDCMIAGRVEIIELTTHVTVTSSV